MTSCLAQACVTQWRTEERIRGVRTLWLEPLPLACDLRNKRVRMRQNMVFSTKNTENFLVRGHSSLPRPFPQWGGGYPLNRPTTLGACGTWTPPIQKSWVRHWRHGACVFHVRGQQVRIVMIRKVAAEIAATAMRCRASLFAGERSSRVILRLKWLRRQNKA